MSTISSTSVLSFLTWSRLATVTIGTYWSLSIWEMRYMSLARFSLRGKEEAEELSDTLGCSSDMWEVEFYLYLLKCTVIPVVTLNYSIHWITSLGNPTGANVVMCTTGETLEPLSYFSLQPLHTWLLYLCNCEPTGFLKRKSNAAAHSFTFCKYFLILHFITRQHPLVSLSPFRNWSLSFWFCCFYCSFGKARR